MIAALLAALALTTPELTPDSRGWSGLSYLATTADEAKVELEFPDQLDWEYIDSRDLLMFILPGDDLEPDELVDFVEDGGYAVIVYDVGQRDAVARMFGVRLTDEAVIHDSYYRDHPSFPRLTPSSDHFLWFNVEEIVLNHPAALTVDHLARGLGKARTLIDFAEPEQSFAVEVRRGDGAVLFLSDVSVFINDMQRHSYGDKQFVANVLRYYCPTPKRGEEGACKVTVVLPSAVVLGSYWPPGSDGIHSIEEMFAVAIKELNALAPEVSDYLGERDRLAWLSALVALLIVLVALLSPWPGTVPRFAWQEAARYRPSHVDYWVRALSSVRANADFSEAAHALKVRFDRSIGRHLSGDLLTRVDTLAGREALAAAVARAAGDDAGRAALRCLDTFHKVRLGETSGPQPAARLSLGAFDQLWRDCTRVIEAVGASDGRRR